MDVPPQVEDLKLVQVVEEKVQVEVKATIQPLYKVIYSLIFFYFQKRDLFNKLMPSYFLFIDSKQ